MQKPDLLPVIVGSVGGLNPAGRHGSLQGYRYIIRDHLTPESRRETIVHQARLMSLIRWDREANSWRLAGSGERLRETEIVERLGGDLDAHCFIRKPDSKNHFDPYAIPIHRRALLEKGEIVWSKK